MDRVVGQAVVLSLDGVVAEVIHLTNADSPTVGQCFAVLFAELGLPPPVYVASKDELSTLDSIFDARLAFYGSYLSGAKEFRQGVGRTHDRTVRVTVDDDTLRRYVQWYLRCATADYAPPVSAG